MPRSAGRKKAAASGARDAVSRNPLSHPAHPLLKMLEGGDRRSIGKSNKAAALVLEEPGRMDALFSGMASGDPLVRMRCADAAEKVTALHPEYLHPYKDVLLNTLSKTGQKEVRWHVAPMLARLPLTEAEQKNAVDILLAYLNDRSSIVKTFAMQALADLAARDGKLRPLVLRHIRELAVTGTPAMKARGKKLLARLDRAAAR